METTIIRIGNSRGIIIPSAILKRLGVKEGDKVKLEENSSGSFTLSFPPEEEPYTGPFTGPFKALAPLQEMEDPLEGMELKKKQLAMKIIEDIKEFSW